MILLIVVVYGVLLQVHAYIIHYLRKQMPYLLGKSDKQKRLLDRLDQWAINTHHALLTYCRSCHYYNSLNIVLLDLVIDYLTTAFFVFYFIDMFCREFLACARRLVISCHTHILVLLHKMQYRVHIVSTVFLQFENIPNTLLVGVCFRYNLPLGDFPSVDKYRKMLSEVRFNHIVSCSGTLNYLKWEYITKCDLNRSKTFQNLKDWTNQWSRKWIVRWQ